MLKKIAITFLLFISIFSFSQKNRNTVGFIENKGQIIDQNQKENKSVLYLLNTNGLNVQLRKNGFSYDVYEIKTRPVSKNKNQKDELNLNSFKNQPEIKQKIKFHRIDIDFLNTNSNVKLVSEKKSIDYDNYYNVAHAPNGITNVHKYQKVTYQNIYNKIDVVFFIPEDSTKVVEYNFVVKPGGKISDIQMQFKGAKTELANNKIKMTTRFGAMEETLPMSWIEEDNSKKQISIHYKKIKNNVYGLESSEDLTGKKVIIDPVPVRLWGTYYGDNSTFGRCLSTDDLNNIYFSGGTQSLNNIATLGSFQNQIQGQSDGFIFKFSPNGNRIWGTYLGGENHDIIYTSDIKGNNLAVAGSTQSYSNISTPSTHSEIYNLGNGIDTGSGSSKNDCFVNQFDLNGFRIWGTYYGGESNEYPLDLAIDNNDMIIIVGVTYSVQGISTPGSFKAIRTQPVNVNTTGEGFVAKFNSSGNLIWGTYYGLNEIRAVDTDSNLNIFISGDTGGNQYISTAGTHQLNISHNTSTGVHYYDSFIGKFDTNGNRIWGTYFGGYDAEYNQDLKIDTEDNIYISGYTYSNNFISTPNSHQEVYGGGNNDSYLAKFSQSGLIMWGTYYGGNSLEQWPTKIAINNNNDIFLSGATLSSNNISTIGAYSESLNSTGDIFITKFNKYGTRIWGTYFGGNSTDYCQGIDIDNIGGINIFGYSYSTDEISTPNSFQEYSGFLPGRFLQRFFDCQASILASSNTPNCIGSTLNLTASGGTNYTWAGPNGFTSNLQNPSISIVNATHSGQYTCTITGTGDCDGIQTINVFVGDNTKPIPTTNPLPTINGDCNTIITVPTATDNCAGLINGITTDQLTNLLPGTHTIHWSYNDGNGNIETQNQTVIISTVTLPTLASPQTFCIQQNATLNSIVITGQNIKWYDAPTNGNLLPNTTVLVNGTTYYASQTINGCESNRVPVLVQIQNTPTPSGNTNQSFCSTANATVADIIATGTNVVWYNSVSSTTPLANTTLLTNNTTFYATQTINGCVSANRLAVTISLINTLNATNYSTVICDNLNDNTEISNLNTYNSNLISSTGNIFSYYNSYNDALSQNSAGQITNSTNYNLVLGTNTFYVRIASPNTCFQIVTLTLDLVSKPIIPINDIEPLCEGRNITLNGGNNYDSYTWSTGETSQQITITQPGNYSVIVTENHGSITCTSTKNFTVVNSNIATIQEIISSDWTDNNNTITVILHNNSQGDYEYSLNGIDFQDSNVFNNLEAGEYTVFVRDKNGCGMVSGDLYLLMYPKFFTPNGDGYNDYWKIKFSENEPNLAVKIFDRYGKLLKHLGMNSMGWDGKYLGKDVPSSDYWFVVTRENGKELKGHFSLKR